MSDSSHGTHSKVQFDPEAFLSKTGAGIALERFQANQQIFIQGEPAGTLGYIRKGRVKATTLSNRGKEGIIGIFRRGQFFGETCLSIAGVRTANIVALEECLITTITREAMLSALGSEPHFSAFFLSQLLSRNARLEEDLTDQLFNSSERRLARLLIVLANFDQKGEAGEVIINQEALAEMVGTTRSRISTFMNKFRDSGLIDYDSHSRRIVVYIAPLLSELGG
jgi:CRP/FNR family transcriptional regulator, cyclic AMP receptor protein